MKYREAYLFGEQVVKYTFRCANGWDTNDYQFHRAVPARSENVGALRSQRPQYNEMRGSINNVSDTQPQEFPRRHLEG